MRSYLRIDRLLHVVGFLHRTTARQPVGYRVVLVGQYRTVLHHVRVLFGFQQHAVVTDDDDRFDHVAVVLGG